MCALIRIFAFVFFISSVQLAASIGHVRMVRKEASRILEKDNTTIDVPEPPSAADAVVIDHADADADVENSSDIMMKPHDLEEFWTTESREGNGKWDTTLPGKPLGNDDHTVFMIFQTPMEYSGKREWLLNIGQRTTGAHHWLWNGAWSSQMGVWNGGQVQVKLLPTGKNMNHWPVKTMATVFSAGTLTLYVNGQAKGSAPMKFDIKDGKVKIGKAALPGESDFSGTIRHVRIYRKALAAAEVRELCHDHV